MVHAKAQRKMLKLAKRILKRALESSRLQNSLLLQLNNGRASAALIRRGLGEACYVRVALQELGYGFAERACAVAVYDANVVDAVHKCFIKKFVCRVNCFVRSAAYEVQFRTNLFIRWNEMNFCSARDAQFCSTPLFGFSGRSFYQFQIFRLFA